MLVKDHSFLSGYNKRIYLHINELMHFQFFIFSKSYKYLYIGVIVATLVKLNNF